MMEQLEEAAKLAQPIPETTQFYHDMECGVTYAMDISFNREDMLETIHDYDEPIGFLVGTSHVHPNDNYCKKTGRELAGRRLRPQLFKLREIYNNDGKLYLTYSNESRIVEFRLNKNSDKPHLIRVS